MATLAKKKDLTGVYHDTNNLRKFKGPIGERQLYDPRKRPQRLNLTGRHTAQRKGQEPIKGRVWSIMWGVCL